LENKFPKALSDRFPELELVKEEKFKYLYNDNVDVMFYSGRENNRNLSKKQEEHMKQGLLYKQEWAQHDCPARL